MAEIWAAAVATVAVGAYSANQQSKAAQGAANAAQGAADASTAEQRRQYDQTRSDMMPWLNQGGWALGQQRAFLEGDWSGFEDSPDYLFAVDQGNKALSRAAAANGSLVSGGTDADRIALGQGLATQYAGNYWNRLAGLSNTGQTTAAGLGGLGANMAGQIGQNAWGAANARGSSYQQRADANSQLAAGVGNAFGQWYGANVNQPAQQQPFAWQPQQQGWMSNGLGPSNGNAWNFGGTV